MPRGRYWTTKEEELLVAYANRGAAYIRRQLKAELGRDRTENSIAKRASRIGISLAVYDVCPECRRTVRKGGLSKYSGLCRLCNERWMASVSRKAREAAERPYSPEEERLIAEYRRERDRERKQKQRLLDRSRDLEAALASAKANSR